MSLVSLENVSVYFKSERNPREQVGALVGVNLSIEPGEIIAVVGESGCGKTTLGKVITDIYQPTEGRVLYKGKELRKLTKQEYKEYRLGVQMIHQDSYAALNPNRTIFQSLSLPLLQHRLAHNQHDAWDQLSELFVEIGLTPPAQFLQKYPHQLSGGQRQRILLARALSVKPTLIVADEPVSMVDVSLRISLLDLMARANQKLGVSFVYITHDLGTARYIAHHGRIAVMYLGRMVEINQIQAALDHPAHPYFHALISAVPEADPTLRGERLTQLPLRSFDMPSVTNAPPGCKFHPRCPYAQEICEREEPKLREFEGGLVACHLAESIRAGMNGRFSTSSNS
ncbi:ABC transporter ATP-binding protein [Symbiobacterium thermophilum]|uniref:Oligoeptide ABC transporter ATP-binding protein n=1 Tax=Symbiobacterium thermophilum (strain DSM 24528 / JCM 14929 / IAM 14863 / T) TaxID=292459 RepID=Q67SR2_SYMTH|nr:ABC transporter ATP-binding protein [Symbiobacterium thermophilum]BAD39281.1 oligoeptide ABC transporter ATP-binding protein [Symbiobacterium thermophilum IAM 14863]